MRAELRILLAASLAPLAVLHACTSAPSAVSPVVNTTLDAQGQSDARENADGGQDVPTDATTTVDDAGPPPGFECTADCTALVQVPDESARRDYALLSPRKYQYGRREMVQTLLASAYTLRDQSPGLAPIGIADLSQADGEIPGTDVRVPRHPAPSHTDGFSVDLAYFRVGGKTLLDEPACQAATDRTFCTGPHDLDVEANVSLMLLLARNKRMVQLIVDPVMEEDLRVAIQRRDDPAAAHLLTAMTSGIAFHADHFHVSFSRQCYDGKDNDSDGLVDLDDPGCSSAVDDSEM